MLPWQHLLPGVAEKLISSNLCRGMENEEPIKIFVSAKKKKRKKVLLLGLKLNKLIGLNVLMHRHTVAFHPGNNGQNVKGTFILSSKICKIHAMSTTMKTLVLTQIIIQKVSITDRCVVSVLLKVRLVLTMLWNVSKNTQKMSKTGPGHCGEQWPCPEFYC